jgi:hypothetical protein
MRHDQLRLSTSCYPGLDASYSADTWAPYTSYPPKSPGASWYTHVDDTGMVASYSPYPGASDSAYYPDPSRVARDTDTYNSGVVAADTADSRDSNSPVSSGAILPVGLTECSMSPREVNPTWRRLR